MGLMREYKRQHNKKKKSKKMEKNDGKLPPNDKQTQTEDIGVNTQQTQTNELDVDKESAEDIAKNIVNSLIDDITSDVFADDMKEQKEQKDETILTEHIRSVKSTKKILGLNTMTTELPKEELVQIIDEVKEI